MPSYGHVIVRSPVVHPPPGQVAPPLPPVAAPPLALPPVRGLWPPVALPPDAAPPLPAPASGVPVFSGSHAATSPTQPSTRTSATSLVIELSILVIKVPTDLCPDPVQWARSSPALRGSKLPHPGRSGKRRICHTLLAPSQNVITVTGRGIHPNAATTANEQQSRKSPRRSPRLPGKRRSHVSTAVADSIPSLFSSPLRNSRVAPEDEPSKSCNRRARVDRTTIRIQDLGNVRLRRAKVPGRGERRQACCAGAARGVTSGPSDPLRLRRRAPPTVRSERVISGFCRSVADGPGQAIRTAMTSPSPIRRPVRPPPHGVVRLRSTDG
jgi:hypothetical protein